MKIMPKELASAVSGALRINENSGYLSFDRFTDKQFEVAKEKESDVLHTKSDSGVKIEFVTNSEKLKFSYTPYLASGSTECFIDVYIDGIMKFHIGENPIKSERHNVSLDLGNGRKRIAMYLPCLFYVEIGDFAIDDGSIFEPVSHNRKLLVLGDSITQGCNAIFPSQSYPNLLGADFDAEVVNQGISGDSYRPERLDEDLPYNPDTVFVAYGTNDWGANVFDEQKIKAYYKKLTVLYPTQKIYVLLPIWRVTEDGRYDSFLRSREIIAGICGEYENISVIDTIDFVPHYPDFFYDGTLHPNDMGFIYYAKGIVKAVREIEKTN